jgi:hypothetical protein
MLLVKSWDRVIVRAIKALLKKKRENPILDQTSR